MKLQVTEETGDFLLQAQGILLARFDRSRLVFEHVRFRLDQPPIWHIWQPRFSLLPNSPFDPAWDAVNAKIKATIDDDTIRLEFQTGSLAGDLEIRSSVVVRVTDSGEVTYDCHQVLDVKRDFVLADSTRGYLPDTDRHFAFLEYTDPYSLLAIGPATPFTRDHPDHLWPLPVFRKDQRKHWQQTAWLDESGEILAQPHNHAMPSGLFPVARGGWLGFFLEPEGLNPVFELDPDSAEQTVAHLCEWAYDIHLGILVPTESGGAILRKGKSYEAKYRCSALDAPEARQRLQGVKLRPLTAEQQETLNRPAYVAGVNAFSEPIQAEDLRWPWVAGPGAGWDREVGHLDAHSLRLDSKSGEAFWEIKVGRENFMDPLRVGERCRLCAWVKTAEPQGGIVRLGFGYGVARQPGVTGEALEMEYYWSEEIREATDWTQIEVDGLPVPENTMWAHLLLKLEGPGTAWFDDVAFHHFSECSCG